MTRNTDTDINLKLDTKGRLKHLEDWAEAVAELLARKDGLTLTEAHWEVLRVMREYYRQYNITPPKKLLKKALAEKLGADKATDDYLDALFPLGVLSQGCRIAGLPEPLLDIEIGYRLKQEQSAAAGETSHFTEEFEFGGRTYEVNEKGNLVDLDAWNEPLAEFLAHKEGIILTAEHWSVIRFLRKFYSEYGITPMVRLLMKHARAELGPEKSSRAHLYSLFPLGPSRQGSRIAGLPEPQGCIDG